MDLNRVWAVVSVHVVHGLRARLNWEPRGILGVLLPENGH